MKSRPNTALFEKFTRAVAEVKEWLRLHRHERVRDVAAALRARLLGHCNYYGVIGNTKRLDAFWRAVQQLWFRQLNCRSQRRSYSWTGFKDMWHALRMPASRVVERDYVPSGLQTCWC